MERNYVIVCNEHRATLPGTLLFWGTHTEDDAERSFSGYTCQINKCERYTREEMEKFQGNLKKEYPFFEEVEPGTFFQHNEVIITLEQLKSLHFREMHVMCR